MKFNAILFGIILLIVIIWLYMQDRIPKEDDNPKIKKLEKELSSEKGKKFYGDCCSNWRNMHDNINIFKLKKI